MKVISLSQSDLDDLEKLARAATQAEWQLGHTGTETHEGALAWMAESIAKSDDTDLWMVFTGDPAGEVLTPAYTGNGPTSQANAEYLAAVQPRNVLNLIAFLRELLGGRRVIDITVPKK